MRKYWWFVTICALGAALVHVGYNEIRVHLLHRLTWTSRDFAWMAPIAYLGYFMLLGALAAPFTRARATVVGAFAAWSLLLLWTGLHPLALLVLALGVGRLMAGLQSKLSPRQLRNVAVCLTLLLCVAAVRVRGGGKASATVAANAPNVLLLILDTVGAKHMSLYGYGRPTTPRLEQLARESIVFDNAFATSSWSLPSHTGIFTGLLPQEHGGNYLEPIRREVYSVAQAFQSHGYATGGFTANIGYAGYQAGFGRGFDHFEDYPRSLSELALTPTFSQIEAVRLAGENLRGGYLRGALFAFRPQNLRIVGVRRAPRRPAADVIRRFHRWRAKTSRPFFAFINLMEAHSPYEPPMPFRTRWGESEADRYDGAVAYLDSVATALVESLPRNTVVVITADHGEGWGEHGFDGHGNTLYVSVLRIPLIIHVPQRVTARVSSPVSLRDISATMLDLAGLPHAAVPGTPLRNAWERGATGLVFAEATQGKNVPSNFQNFSGPVRSLLDSTTHYIRFPTGREELYAWRSDRDELNNLAKQKEHAETLRRYRTLFDSVYPDSVR